MHVLKAEVVHRDLQSPEVAAGGGSTVPMTSSLDRMRDEGAIMFIRSSSGTSSNLR